MSGTALKELRESFPPFCKVRVPPLIPAGYQFREGEVRPSDWEGIVLGITNNCLLIYNQHYLPEDYPVRARGEIFSIYVLNTVPSVTRINEKAAVLAARKQKFEALFSQELFGAKLLD